MRLHHHLSLVNKCWPLLAHHSHNSASVLVVGSWSPHPWPQSTWCSWTVQISACHLYMPNLHPGLEELPRIGWHENVSCYSHGWHNKRSRLFLFSATMLKPPQDYQVIVSHHCHEENKSYYTSRGSGSLRWRRSYWIFFCTPTYCGASPTTTKSNQNQIIVQPHTHHITPLLNHLQLPQVVPTYDPQSHWEILPRYNTLTHWHHLLPHHLLVPQTLSPLVPPTFPST